MMKKKNLESKSIGYLREIAKEFHFWIPGEKEALSESKYYFSTGSTLLDLAIQKEGKGVPSGRIIEVSGAESTGKTVVGAAIGGNCQKQEGVTILFDVEETFDFERGRIYGLDPDKILVPEIQYGTIESLFTVIKDILVKTDEKCYCFIIDSVAALESLEEVDAGYEASTYGTERAKKLSRILRSLPRLISEKQATLLFINQVRDKIGGYGRKDETTGGRAIKFYASCRIYLSMTGKIKDENKTVIGIDVEAELIKNKIDRPFLKACFPIYFSGGKYGGIDDLESCVSFLRKNSGFLGSKKEWFTYGEIKKQSLAEFLNVLEENKVDKEIYAETKKLWNIIYNCDREKR